MENVRYYVPTRGRTDDQRTLSYVPPPLLWRFTIVCPSHEVAIHEANWPDCEVLAQPDDVVTIGAKRKFIYEHAASRDVQFAWQLDDDLKMKVLVDGKHVTASKHPEATQRALEQLETLTEHYHALGIGTSFMAPRGGVRDNYHLGFAFGFHRDFYEHRLVTGRMDAFEDVDFTLQALRARVRIGVTYDLVVDQVKHDAPGGVSGQRTSDTIMQDLATLMEAHPGLITEKPLKPGAHPASIIRVAWAKAAKQGGL